MDEQWAITAVLEGGGSRLQPWGQGLPEGRGQL